MFDELVVTSLSYHTCAQSCFPKAHSSIVLLHLHRRLAYCRAGRSGMRGTPDGGGGGAPTRGDNGGCELGGGGGGPVRPGACGAGRWGVSVADDMGRVMLAADGAGGPRPSKSSSARTGGGTGVDTVLIDTSEIMDKASLTA